MFGGYDLGGFRRVIKLITLLRMLIRARPALPFLRPLILPPNEVGESRIGAELKAAQERGEVATRDRGGANIANGVQGADTVATLSELGIPRQRAAEMKRAAGFR